jgi:hypothetical protein
MKILRTETTSLIFGMAVVQPMPPILPFHVDHPIAPRVEYTVGPIVKKAGGV